MTISKDFCKVHDILCRKDTYKPQNELVMDISSIGGVSSVKKAEMTEVTKSNSDRGYSRSSSSRGDIVELSEGGRERYLINSLGRHKPEHSLLGFQGNSSIDEQIENDDYQVDIDSLAQKLNLFM